MENKIVKIASEFCYVKTIEGDILPCKARGLFKKKGYRPLVGDRVNFKKISADQGVIEEIMPRKNELQRPYVANIDQVVVVIAAKAPDPNYKLLDRILVLSYFNKAKSLICVNKLDLDNNKGLEIQDKYKSIGYDCVALSVKDKTGLSNLREKLSDKTSVLAGTSGVGKSSIINAIEPGFSLKTDEVSKKTGRGKHTTRQVTLFELGENTYVADTPGFSKLNFKGIDYQELDRSFPEIKEYSAMCKFNDCLHDKEPGCEVKEKIGSEIYEDRYNNYLEFLNELKKGAAYHG
ncbi:ribosome small subunit-dependent GTPase A [Natranaerofaba carboxydovora]|uniref:ribosome small subunit-dependent GTPase A n=1 Tax=Natranaerofaba carboxydovora TaxID=2742683 RepID=UPI001F140DD2|nr:ribosome small subunit-dependent GTPase A [Natranaerofaba carboxydovora]UMZ73304.1 Small ribosomal subunit biogenesis GTPase RsgA [Natranaerofaba carboxydovora]